MRRSVYVGRRYKYFLVTFLKNNFFPSHFTVISHSCKKKKLFWELEKLKHFHVMPLGWENRNNSYYLFRRGFTRQAHTGMAGSNDVTTVDSLIQIIQQTTTRTGFYYGSYQRRNSFDQMYYVDCDEVFPNIFIGDGSTAKLKDYLRKIGITHVLNTAEGKEFSMVDTNRFFYEDVGIKYLGFPLLDHPSSNISQYFNEAAEFIQNALDSGGRVYVHCLMGMSRSSTCVLAYLMLKRGMTAADALRTVKEKRSIHPNEGFLQQLANLDNSLRRTKRSW